MQVWERGRQAAVSSGWWALAFAASIGLYWAGLRAGYFSDDLLFFFNKPPQHLYEYFAIHGAAPQAYRPLEAILLTAIQQHFHFNTLPIHLCSLACHAAMVCVVLAASRQLAMSGAERALAWIFALVAQVGAPAVLGNDCFSQVGSALFGALSAWFLYRGWMPGNEAGTVGISSKWVWGSAAAYATSLFLKETGLGFLLAALTISALIAYRERGWAGRFKKAVVLSIPFGAATVVYWLARLHAGGAVSKSGSYQVRVGFNVIRNLAEFALAAFGPFSTVDGAIAFSMRHVPELLLQMAGFCFVAIVIAGGAYRSRRWAVCGVLAALAVASLFPAYLLTHVSELYLYNAIPFLALLFGISLGSLWTEGRWLRATAVVCATLLFCADIGADVEKAKMMARNGERAAAIYAQIEQYLPSLPRNGEVFLVNPATRDPEYSVFLLRGLDVVEIGTWRIGPIFGRPDVRVEIMEERDARMLERRSDRLLLAQGANGKLEPWATPGSR